MILGKQNEKRTKAILNNLRKEERNEILKSIDRCFKYGRVKAIL